MTLYFLGVIRVREALLSLAQRPYSLQVIAEDCSRPVPHRASVSVTIEQILIDCKPGWKSKLFCSYVIHLLVFTMVIIMFSVDFKLNNAFISLNFVL